METEPKFQTFVNVIDAWPSGAALGRDLTGLLVDEVVNEVRVSAWRQRDSIPPEFWPALVVAAEGRDIDGVTLEVLARLAGTRRGVELKIVSMA